MALSCAIYLPQSDQAVRKLAYFPQAHVLFVKFNIIQCSSTNTWTTLSLCSLTELAKGCTFDVILQMRVNIHNEKNLVLKKNCKNILCLHVIVQIISYYSTAELRYVEVVGTQKNTSTQEWFEITNWTLWGAKHFDKILVLK